MNSLVYDTFDHSDFFYKVSGAFLESFVYKMKPLIKKNSNFIYSEEFILNTLFLCKKLTASCSCGYDSVILSNVQIRKFLKCRDDKYNYYALRKNDSGYAMLFEEKLYKLKGTAHYDYLYAIDDNGKIANFAYAIVNIINRYDKKIEEKQKRHEFFNGVINSLSKNEQIHYISNEKPNSKKNSPGFKIFSSIYKNKKGTLPDFCLKEDKLNCDLFKKIYLTKLIQPKK